MLVFSDHSKQYEKMNLAPNGGGLTRFTLLRAHFGKSKCVNLSTKRYHWPRITVDVAMYLASCHRCHTFKSVKLQKANSLLHVMSVLKKGFK